MEHYALLAKLAVRSTRRRTCLALLTAIALATCAGDVPHDDGLARRLADDRTRDSAVAQAVASADSSLPLLLLWAEHPPPQVGRDGLYIGMADVFARLRARAAIPFLIRNLGVSRDQIGVPWLKTAKRIEDVYPMAAALIAIGPEACEAIAAASEQPMRREDRLVSIFVVARVISRGGSFPEAREYLSSAAGQAFQERLWAEEGLRHLDENPH